MQWKKPLLSAKSVAKLRREAVLNGHTWPWDTPKKPAALADASDDEEVRTVDNSCVSFCSTA